MGQMSGPLTFHVVDDDPDVLDLVVGFLRAEGHEVRTSATSADALADILASPPDCVISDIMMPDIDGLELLRRIRQAPGLEDTKVIMVSGKAYDFDRRRAMDFGADGYVVKPFSRAQFLNKVRHITGERISLRFWGVRGTLPVSGPRSVRYGGNTNCISLGFHHEHMFIFDAGTGIRELGNHLMRKGITRLNATLLLSHPHWDHINALPFFTPLYLPGNQVEVIGPSQGDLSVQDLVSAQMEGVYFPITVREFGAHLTYRSIREEQFEVHGVQVRSILLTHPGYCLGYRVEHRGRSVCYITDNELYPEDLPQHSASERARLVEFIRGADALITDTSYLDEAYRQRVDWGHSCVSEVARLAHDAEVTTLYLHHHEPDQDDAAIDQKLELAQAWLARAGSKTVVVAPKEGDEVLL